MMVLCISAVKILIYTEVREDQKIRSSDSDVPKATITENVSAEKQLLLAIEAIRILSMRAPLANKIGIVLYGRLAGTYSGPIPSSNIAE